MEIGMCKKEKIFDEKTSIMIMQEFEPLDENLVRLKYPAENRPQKILATDNGAVCLTFQMTFIELTEQTIPPIVQMIKQNIHKMQPAIQFIEEGVEKVGDIPYGWFDFKGFAIDGPIYYLQVLLSIDRKMCNMSLSVPYEQREKWKQETFRMLQTIMRE